MSLLSRAPRPALPEHPEFAIMVTVTLERFHCTLGEVREDYWLGRMWRALAGDPLLVGRVARLGVDSLLVTGPRFAEAPRDLPQRWRLERRVTDRLAADTGHTAQHMGLRIRFAETPVEVAEGCLKSLIAQTVEGDARWLDLGAYADDLAPVVVPVAFAVERVVAA